MGRLLFKENPGESHDYVRANKTARVLFAVLTTVFLALGCICLCLEQPIASTFPFGAAIWSGFCVIKTVLQGQQRLRVFEDRICYKNTYQRREKDVCLPASQYAIELKRAVPNSGYTVQFVFKKPNGKRLFVYRAVSLVPSRFQEERQPWEVDLFAIGCAVTDPQEVLKNK